MSNLDTPLKSIEENFTLIQAITKYAPIFLTAQQIGDLIDTKTSSTNFINTLLNDAGFLTFLGNYLTTYNAAHPTATLNAAELLAKLTSTNDFPSYLLNFLIANGFVNLAGTIAGVEADSGFLAFLNSFLKTNSTPQSSALDYNALAANSTFLAALNAAIAAYLAANPPAVQAVSLFLAGDIKGAITSNRVDKIFGIPVDDTPFRAIARSFEEDFNNFVQVGSAPVVLNSIYQIYGLGAKVTISQITETNGDKTLRISYDGTGSVDLAVYIRSVGTFDGLGKRMDMFFQNTGLAGASSFQFGMIDSANRTNSMNTAIANQRGFFETVLQNTYPQVAGAVGDVNHGTYNGMAAQASGKGTDFKIMRLETTKGKATWLTGGESFGWSEEKQVTPPSASVYTSFIIAADIVFDHTAGAQHFDIKYISTNIATGAPGADLTLKYIAADNSFECV